MKAVVKNGVIHAQDPLPEDWSEGTELEIEKVFTPLSGGALDQWYQELEALAFQGDAEDDERLMRAIQEIRQQEKDLARKKARPME